MRKNTDICFTCEHKREDIKQGILCGLTGMKPDFEDSCKKYKYSEANKQFKNSNVFGNKSYLFNKDVASGIKDNREDYRSSYAARNMTQGGIICLIGIIATVLTYAFPIFGGSYIIFWGAIIWGFYRFIIGLLNI